MNYTIWHNPRCSKSRAALALLEEHGIKPHIVEYLKTPPSATELKRVLARLGIGPEELLRKGEDLYKSEYAGRQLTAAQWMDAMVKHPVLIERPVVIAGERAVIGRPTERVLELLK